MKFLADENIDCQIVTALRQAGHEVMYVAELDPGITDDQVLDLAHRGSGRNIWTRKVFSMRCLPTNLTREIFFDYKHSHVNI